LFTTRTTGSPEFNLAPFAGATGVGGETLRLFVSAEAPGLATTVLLGDVGVPECLLHAAASAIAETAETKQSFRIIDRSLPDTKDNKNS
jgi:hypothetical protein